jgi:hypothetical protein
LLALLAVLLGAAALLLWPRDGLLGGYFAQDTAGREALVAARVDPAIDFPSAQVLAAPFYQHWNTALLGVPRHLPPFTVRWSGFLRARVSGLYRLRLESSGRARLLLDGQPLTPGADANEMWAEANLAQGWHRLEITYARADEEPGIRLVWLPPYARDSETVPPHVLAPSEQALRQALARNVAGGLAALGFLALLLHLWRTRRATGSSFALLRARRHGAALVVAVALGLGLRAYQYDLIPFHHETADEYQHGWEGWTLIHEGVPAAWTFYPQRYPPEKISPFLWFGDSYYLARPYFDHPPGFSLLVGAASSALGAESMLDCTLRRMRVIPMLLGAMTTFLVGWVGWKTLPRRSAGTMAALVYATLPTIVLGNRLVKAENLLAPLMLLLTMWLQAYAAGNRPRDLAKIVIAGAAGIWAKATGIALPLAAALVLSQQRKGRAVAAVALGAGAAIALYLLYGAAYDWPLFMKVLGLQASKRVAVRTLLDLEGISRIVEVQFGGGWYLWLAMAVAWMALGKHRAILAPAAVYLGVMALTADVRGVFGWYRLPLFPYLCLAGGWFLSEWWEAKDAGRGFLFCLTALATTLAYGLPPAVESSRAAVLALLILCGAVPAWAALRPTPRSSRARDWSMIAALGLFFAGNVWIVMHQVPIYLREGVRGKAPAVAQVPPR